MIIKITYPNLLHGCNSFAFSAWIINGFRCVLRSRSCAAALLSRNLPSVRVPLKFGACLTGTCEDLLLISTSLLCFVDSFATNNWSVDRFECHNNFIASKLIVVVHGFFSINHYRPIAAIVFKLTQILSLTGKWGLCAFDNCRVNPCSFKRAWIPWHRNVPWLLPFRPQISWLCHISC